MQEMYTEAQLAELDRRAACYELQQEALRSRQPDAAATGPGANPALKRPAWNFLRQLLRFRRLRSRGDLGSRMLTGKGD